MLILPDNDILFRAFNRQMPDALVAREFQKQCADRSLILGSATRLTCLARTRNVHQLDRLMQMLAAFPVVREQREDAVEAARLLHLADENGVRLGLDQALLAAQAARIGALVWSHDYRWQRLGQVCPHRYDDGLMVL